MFLQDELELVDGCRVLGSVIGCYYRNKIGRLITKAAQNFGKELTVQAKISRQNI